MSTPTREIDERTAKGGESFRVASPASKRRMLIIVNPYASTVSDRLRHLVVYALQGRFEVDAVDTEARGHATELCREAAHEGYDVVVVNGRCFTFASGLGLDASVVERVDSNPQLKARLGAYYFTWVAVSTFLRRYLLSPPRLEAQTRGGETLAGVTAIVQNGSPFTYFQDRPIEIAEGAALDSGLLAGGVLHRATLLSMPSIAWRAFSPRARVAGHRQVSALGDFSELTVRSADGRPLPLQVDGDYLGEVAEARYSIMPDALSVVS